MSGRNKIYKPETLKIGEKIRLKGKNKDFAYQYAYAFRKKNPGKVFKKHKEDGKIFILRVE
jgi:hypothetical protein